MPSISASPKSQQEIVEWVKRKLGHPRLKVELTDDQLNDAFNEAVQWFIGRLGLKKTIMINVVAGQSDYPDFPEDVDDIVSVTPPRMTGWDLAPWEQESAFLGFSGFPVAGNSPLGGGVGGGGGYSALVQGIQYSEQAKRVMSGDFDWEWYPETRTLRIYPKPPESGQMMVSYMMNTIDLKMMNVRMVSLVRKMALAESKHTLGRMRSKYSEWAMAGGEKSMDGDTLLGESQTEKDELNEEISSLSYPVPFSIG